PACSGGGHKRPQAAPTTTTAPAPPIVLTLAAADVQAMVSPPPPFPDPIKTQVLATVQAYVDRAVLAPLRTGAQAPPLGDLFDDVARAHIGADHAAVTDEGLPAATKGVRASVASVALSALAGQDGG